MSVRSCPLDLLVKFLAKFLLPQFFTAEYHVEGLHLFSGGFLKFSLGRPNCVYNGLHLFLGGVNCGLHLFPANLQFGPHLSLAGIHPFLVGSYGHRAFVAGTHVADQMF